jgi:hypothetical protein
VDTVWDAAEFDISYYQAQLEKASEEIAFALRSSPL